MIGFFRGPLTVGALLATSVIGSAQPLSQSICAAAVNYFGAAGVPANTELLLMSEALASSSRWTPLSVGRDAPFSQGTRAVYLAYFFSAPYVTVYGANDSQNTGAISIKVAVATDPSNRGTSTIDLHRPAISRGTNRCERRGLPAIENRHVGINEYIDYHNRNGNSSNIEDFHFQYPYGTAECAYTDRPQEVAATFQFNGVKPIGSNTAVARLFGGYFGTAIAAETSGFSNLRSELHFYSRAGGAPGCIGFLAPVNTVGTAAIIQINDLSWNWYSERGSWSIHRQ